MMESQSQSSEWEPEIQNSKTMFTRIQIEFSNEEIAKKVEQQLSHPYFHNDDELDPEDRPTVERDIEALYDPLNDDDNQRWVNTQMNRKTQTKNKPALVCPSCFLQLAFVYEQIGPSQYLVHNPQHIEVLETKVIRDRNAPQQMGKVAEQNVGKYLIQRQEEFNVKIVCSCECGNDSGYYDVNKGAYILSNVI